jgi:hypothetical protein
MAIRGRSRLPRCSFLWPLVRDGLGPPGKRGPDVLDAGAGRNRPGKLRAERGEGHGHRPDAQARGVKPGVISPPWGWRREYWRLTPRRCHSQTPPSTALRATALRSRRRSCGHRLQQVLHQRILHAGLIQGALDGGRAFKRRRTLERRRTSPRSGVLAAAPSPDAHRCGLREVSTEVQHFRPEDTFIMASLRRRGWLVRRTTCDRIGLALSGMSSGVACGARGRGCRLVKRS